MSLFKHDKRILLIACIGLIAAVTSGCHYFYDQIGEQKRMPSPIPDILPAEIQGKIYRVWCGNELQIKNELHTTYLILQGVNNPDLDHATEKAAVDYMYSLIESEHIRAVVVQYDERKRAIAQVYSGDTNFNYQMIRNGWGQFDGSVFSESDRYQQAEELAREQALGMWGAVTSNIGESSD